MLRSIDRFLTTHVGSLLGPQNVADQLFAEDQGQPVDRAALDRIMTDTIGPSAVVRSWSKTSHRCTRISPI